MCTAKFKGVNSSQGYVWIAFRETRGPGQFFSGNVYLGLNALVHYTQADFVHGGDDEPFLPAVCLLVLLILLLHIVHVLLKLLLFGLEFLQR